MMILLHDVATKFRCLSSILMVGVLIPTTPHIVLGYPEGTSSGGISHVIGIKQQQRIVSGVVRDEAGEPIAGVTVHPKNLQQPATVTNQEGYYRIRLTPHILLLEFSGIGYEAVEVTTAGKEKIDVVLKASVAQLDEVVVIGYGTVKKRDLTGSVASLDARTLNQSNLNTLESALQGRVAGLSVSTQSGEPGAAAQITIRGANSIHAGSSPLYVIDGILIDVSQGEVSTSNVGGNTSYSPLSTINPRDIESVEVLKDASATAIYGTRGANGVIIVTTRSGRMGMSKTNVNLDVFTSVSEVTKRIPMLDGQQYINYRFEKEPHNAAWGVDSNEDGVLDEPRDVSNLESHNWQDELFRRGAQQNINLSLLGGGKNTSWAGGIGYIKQNALVKNNDYSSYSARLKLNQKLSEKTKFTMNFHLGKNNNLGIASSGGGEGNWSGLVQSIYTFRPVIVHDPITEDEPVSLSSMIYNGYKKTDFNRLLANASLSHQITKQLTLNISGGGTLTSSKLAEFYNSNTLWGRNSDGLARLRDTRTESYIQTNTLTYSTRPFQRDWLTAMVGSEITSYSFETFFARAQKFEDQSTGVFDMSKGLITEPTVSSNTQVARTSLFGRINYSIAGKYVFTGTFRSDGSSNFGANHRFAYFPSAAFAWNVSNEKFMKAMPQINNLKLRMSYGVTGNDRIPPYQGFGRMSPTYYSGNGQLIYGMSLLASPNSRLKWESTTQYNLGLDVGLFSDRINLIAEVYLKKTSDMLLNSEVASQSGFIKQWRNIGNLENKGFELTLNTVNINSKKFEWNTTLNFYLNRSKVTNLGGDADIPVIFPSGYITDAGIVQVGRPLGTAYGYVWDGIYQIDDFTWQNNSDPAIEHADRIYTPREGLLTIAGAAVQPGLFRYQDLNNDGVINESDRTIIGDSNPKFAGGITNEFNYGSFFLNIFVQGVYGNKIMNTFPTMVESGSGENSFNLTREYWTNRWTPDNPSNRYPSIAFNNTDNRASTYFIEDGSFLRLKTVSLGYTFENGLLQKANISNLRLYATVDNVFVLNRYSGLDPEVNSLNPLLPGFDRLAYPRARTYMIGVNVSF